VVPVASGQVVTDSKDIAHRCKITRPYLGAKLGKTPRGTIAARVIVPSRDGLYALQRLQAVGGFGLFWG
jgi:hypothetical protein